VQHNLCNNLILIQIFIFYRYNGTDLVTAETANYGHKSTVLSNYNNLPIAIGASGAPGGKKYEILESGAWVDKGDLPITADRLKYYSTANLNSKLYLFGGQENTSGVGSVTDAVFSYDGTSWISAGTMLGVRARQRTIVRGNTIIHIGGVDTTSSPYSPL
jgi:hypothetical protein